MTACVSTRPAIVTFGFALSSFAAYQLFKLPAVLPLLLEAYGYDRTLAGAFMSVYAVAGLLLSLWLGRRMQQHGPLAPVTGALVLLAAGNLAGLAAPQSGVAMLAARGLEGTGFAALAIAGPLIATGAASARHLPLVVGLMATWMPVGQASAALLAPLLLPLAGWRGLWWLALLLTLGMLLWSRAMRGRISAGPAATSGDPATRPRRTRLPLLLGGGVFLIWSCQYFAYMTWLPQYLVEVFRLDLTAALGGYLVPVATIAAVNLLAGWLLRTGVPLAPLLAASLALQALCWWLLPQAGAGVSGIALMLAYGLGAGIAPTCLFALPSLIAGPGQAAGRAFGALMTGRNIGVLIGPMLLAEAVKRAVGWTLVPGLFAALTAGALVIALVLAVTLARSQGTRR